MVKGYVEDRNKHEFIRFMFEEYKKERSDLIANITCPKERAKFKKQNKKLPTLYSYYKNNYRWLNKEWNKEKSNWLSRGEVS